MLIFRLYNLKTIIYYFSANNLLFQPVVFRKIIDNFAKELNSRIYFLPNKKALIYFDEIVNHKPIFIEFTVKYIHILDLTAENKSHII